MSEHIVFLIFVTAIVVILFFIYSSNKKESFCSSCTGPIVYRYKYGDPFYTYMHDQRRKYERYPSYSKWMNLSEAERNADRNNVKAKIDKWITTSGLNQYGQHPALKYIQGPYRQILNDRYRHIIDSNLEHDYTIRPWEELKGLKFKKY